MVTNTAPNKPVATQAPAPRAATGTVLQSTAAPAAPAAPAAGGQYIALLVPGNPKKPGSKSHARWQACHAHGQTQAAYKAKVIAAGYPAGHAAADIAWEIKHGFVSLHATAALCPARPGPAVTPQVVQPAAG